MEDSIRTTKPAQERFSVGSKVLIHAPSHDRGGEVGFVNSVSRKTDTVRVMLLDASGPQIVAVSRTDAVSNPTEEQIGAAIHGRQLWLDERKREREREVAKHEAAAIAVLNEMGQMREMPHVDWTASDSLYATSYGRFPVSKPEAVFGLEGEPVTAKMVESPHSEGTITIDTLKVFGLDTERIRYRAISVRADNLCTPSELRKLAAELERLAGLVSSMPYLDAR